MFNAKARLESIDRSITKIMKAAQEKFDEAELHGDPGSQNAEFIEAMNRLEDIQAAVEEAAVIALGCS